MTPKSSHHRLAGSGLGGGVFRRFLGALTLHLRPYFIRRRFQLKFLDHLADGDRPGQMTGGLIFTGFQGIDRLGQFLGRDADLGGRGCSLFLRDWLALLQHTEL